MENKIREEVMRKMKKWKTGAWIITIITEMFFLFASLAKNHQSFTLLWWIVTIVGMVSIGIMCGLIFLPVMSMEVNRSVRNEEYETFVHEKLGKDIKKEVKLKEAKDSSFEYNLQKRGKFFAEFKDETKDCIFVTFKYDGEEEEVMYESIDSTELYDKYIFAEEN